jgi:hypothetical protein
MTRSSDVRSKVRPLTRLAGIVAALAVTALLAATAAAAKDFDPGDLRACNARRCVPITNRVVLRSLATFYYGSTRLAGGGSPRMGVPYFELRFRNGYATGIVATAQLDRFLSYGVNLDRFAQGTWYRVPPQAAAELRRLTRPLAPLRLTSSAVAKSH